MRWFYSKIHEIITVEANSVGAQSDELDVVGKLMTAHKSLELKALISHTFPRTSSVSR